MNTHSLTIEEWRVLIGGLRGNCLLTGTRVGDVERAVVDLRISAAMSQFRWKMSHVCPIGSGKVPRYLKTPRGFLVRNWLKAPLAKGLRIRACPDIPKTREIRDIWDIGKCEILLDAHVLGCFMKQTSRQMVDFVSRRGAHHRKSEKWCALGRGSNGIARPNLALGFGILNNH